jgi:serine protease inhibitor
MIMKQMTLPRRLVLKASLAALLGLTGRASVAAILEAASGVNAKGPGGDGLLAAQARLGENLIRALAGGRAAGVSGNLIVSPASLAAIMSFVDLGATTSLRAAIHHTLGFNRVARRQINEDLKALRDGVSAIIAHSEQQDAPLALANLMAFDRSTKPRQLALLGLSGAGADVLVDNLGNAEIIQRINDWVQKKTHGLIPAILDETPETLGLVAVNALYFKDKWKTEFDPAKTTTEKFTPASGEAVDVSMMHSKAALFAFRQDDRFIAAELPYAHEDFKLVVVTTKSEPAKPADFAAVATWLGGQGFEMKTGEIAMPKLSLSADEELLPTLDRLGLKPARLNNDALQGFSDEAMIITRIVQKLELRLAEEGTEAAAVTAVLTTRSLGSPAPVKMTVDKPFVFALRDQKSGLILFMGYVGAPKKLPSSS